MIQQALVYIYAIAPSRAFRGCGVLIEGGYVATCRHVWRMATGEAAGAQVELEFPYGAREQGKLPRRSATLAYGCEPPDGTPPDLVLLRPDGVPAKVLPVEPANHESEQFGDGYVLAGLKGLDPNRPAGIDVRKVEGTIDELPLPDDVHQFMGVGRPTYWFRHGASGSPAFLKEGGKLAGMLTSSEIGEDGAPSDTHEAVVIPARLIRANAVRSMWLEELPPDSHADAPALFDLVAQDKPLRDMRPEIVRAIAAIRARGDAPVPPTHDGASVDDAIAASRRKLADIDTQGSLAILRERVAEEEARNLGLVRLLKEQAAVERMVFDYAAAKASRTRLSQLAPDDVWNWIALGDLCVTRGESDGAARAFGGARDAAFRTSDERDLSVSHERLGNVLVAQGDLAGALTVYRAGMTISERLAASDPNNAQWQRDLSVSHNNLGDVLVAQGDLAGALTVYRAGMTIIARLAASDPGNAEWQRDLSVSHDRLGNVLVAQCDLAGALTAYRAGMTIRARLAASNPGNAEWQRDLSVSHNKLGDVLVAQGDLAGALTVCRAGMTIAERLAASDPGNAEWQRDLSVSHNKLGDVLVAQGDLPGALIVYRAGMTIAERLAASDLANAAWQRDVIVSCVNIADSAPDEARAVLTRALGIAQRLAAEGRLAPADAWIPDDLARRLAALPPG